MSTFLSVLLLHQLGTILHFSDVSYIVSVFPFCLVICSLARTLNSVHLYLAEVNIHIYVHWGLKEMDSLAIGNEIY